MLARDYCQKIGKKDKPVIISHHMMMGLKEGQEKMSKSDLDSAIFMEDTVEEVNRKVKKAFCVQGVVKENPIMDYYKYIVFESFPEILIKRTPENGGDVIYKDYETFEQDFVDMKLHPSDIKTAGAQAINTLL